MIFLDISFDLPTGSRMLFLFYVLFRISTYELSILGYTFMRNFIVKVVQFKPLNGFLVDSVSSIVTGVPPQQSHTNQSVYYIYHIFEYITILFIEPPEATFWKPLPKKVYAELGSKIVLECELDKKYNTIWLKNKKNVNDDTNIEIKNNNHNGKHTITILQLKGTDIGKYSCICVSAETTCELKVQGNIIEKNYYFKEN